MANLEVDDAIVLLLGAPTSHPHLRDRMEGITRLEKLLFLLERESDIGRELEDAAFVSHNFGPFSAKVYQAIDILTAAGLVDDSRRIAAAPDDSWESVEIIGLEGATEEDPYATRDLSLTERGRRYYTALISELPDGVEGEISQFKDQYGSLPLRPLVRYVYGKYPEFTDKSLIRDEVLG